MARTVTDFDKSMLAYCGLYCEQCSVRTAWVEQDACHLDNFPAKFKTGKGDLSDYACEGCKGNNLCGPCRIKDCAAPKGLDSYADCAAFPCQYLNEFENDGIPHHRAALENHRRIRADGVKSWFAWLKPALQCRCGKRQSWYYVCQDHAE
ncbi:MAG: DUF3795 domain-containing protein [Planctomycetes bacterium]|nr:DUF3795 domain-containing protein [Planctomycetota bacterium]